MEINITKMLEEAAENVNAAIKFGAFVLNFRNKVPDEICIEAYYWLHWWRKELGDAMPSSGVFLLNQFATMLKDYQIEESFEEMDKITAQSKAFEECLEQQNSEKRTGKPYRPEDEAWLWSIAWLASASNEYVS